MRASIEAKLRALYAQRAELQAEQDEDMETESESAPAKSITEASRLAAVVPWQLL